eukprot:4165634-Heterocapsa_arctica.AAC.1
MEHRLDRESSRKPIYIGRKFSNLTINEGEEFITLIQETSDRNQWGPANQMAMFAKMENIKIEVYSHGMP